MRKQNIETSTYMIIEPPELKSEWKENQGSQRSCWTKMAHFIKFYWSCAIAQSAELMLWNISLIFKFFAFHYFLINHKMFSYSLYSNSWRTDVLTPCFLTLAFLMHSMPQTLFHCQTGSQDPKEISALVWSD